MSDPSVSRLVGTLAADLRASLAVGLRVRARRLLARGVLLAVAFGLFVVAAGLGGYAAFLALATSWSPVAAALTIAGAGTLAALACTVLALRPWLFTPTPRPAADADTARIEAIADEVGDLVTRLHDEAGRNGGSVAASAFAAGLTLALLGTRR